MKEIMRKFRAWRWSHASRHAKQKRSENFLKEIRVLFNVEPREYRPDQPN